MDYSHERRSNSSPMEYNHPTELIPYLEDVLAGKLTKVEFLFEDPRIRAIYDKIQSYANSTMQEVVDRLPRMRRLTDDSDAPEKTIEDIYGDMAAEQLHAEDDTFSDDDNSSSDFD